MESNTIIWLDNQENKGVLISFAQWRLILHQSVKAHGQASNPRLLGPKKHAPNWNTVKGPSTALDAMVSTRDF